MGGNAQSTSYESQHKDLQILMGPSNRYGPILRSKETIYVDYGKIFRPMEEM